MNKIIVVFIFAVACFGGTSHANDTPPAAMANNETPENKPAVSRYAQGVQAGQNNDYKKALPLFEEALKEDPNNPDILNGLAHAQRETGDIDDALVNYKKALELRPKFPEAHEYLGETYIQAALREVEILKGYGDNAKDQTDDLSRHFKEEANKL
jgi:Tfp pilus assembly protein PilF